MPGPTAAFWVKFFTNAGIPSSAAATYAHVFVENRIQTDMLMELNKEYLREMGISTMGDIIAILRHAKKVSDQSARERVLSGPEMDAVPVAAVTANPSAGSAKAASSSSNGNGISSKITTSRPGSVISLPTVTSKARRVLPEHEGKYKVTLPRGSTERSKEILEKKAQQKTIVTVAGGTKRNNVFDRLNDTDEPPAKTPSIVLRLDDESNSKISSSIFARLGMKDSAIASVSSSHEDSNGRSGILKRTVNKPAPPERKVTATTQKVILVKKIPAKAVKLSDDDVYLNFERIDHANSDTAKSVSFSKEDEVMVIAPRRPNPPGGHMRFQDKDVAVKHRLGGGSSVAPRKMSPLHGTKKVIHMKPGGSPSSSSSSLSKLKSDTMLRNRPKTVRQRLNLDSRPGTDASKLASRLDRFSLATNKGVKVAKVYKSANTSGPGYGGGGGGNSTYSRKQSTSVFNRLGFNRQQT